MQCRKKQQHYSKKKIFLDSVAYECSKQSVVVCLVTAVQYRPPASLPYSWLGFELVGPKASYSLIAVGTSLDAEAE